MGARFRRRVSAAQSARDVTRRIDRLEQATRQVINRLQTFDIVLNALIAELPGMEEKLTARLKAMQAEQEAAQTTQAAIAPEDFHPPLTESP